MIPRPGTALETATWRPIRTVTHGGWRAGVSGGFTHRANSVVTAGPVEDPAAAVDRMEEVYRAAGLPACFRIDRETTPPDLDGMLAGRGYTVSGVTAVAARSLADTAPEEGRPGGSRPPSGEPEVDLEVDPEPSEEWLRGWLSVKTAAPAQAGEHAGAVPAEAECHTRTARPARTADPTGTSEPAEPAPVAPSPMHSASAADDVARRIVTGSPALYLTMRSAGRRTGVARLALAGRWAAISCLMVDAGARRTGVGTGLVDAAMRAGRAGGAEWVFTQVETSNAPSRRMFARSGFADVDIYHYRLQGAAGAC